MRLPPYFLNDGSQRHVRGQSLHPRGRQLHHAATVGALQRQAEGTPDGIVVGHLEQVVQAGLTEGVRAGQDPWVREQRVAHGAGQVFLQGFHGGEGVYGRSVTTGRIKTGMLQLLEVDFNLFMMWSQYTIAHS